MTSYVVLLPGDESAWALTSDEHKQQTYERHGEFAKLLAERGHQATGGAELAPSREAKVLRTDADGTQAVTEGPYAETAEQLTGFYVIDSEDLEDLLDVCKVLGVSEGAIEVRACVGGGAT